MDVYKPMYGKIEVSVEDDAITLPVDMYDFNARKAIAK